MLSTGLIAASVVIGVGLLARERGVGFSDLSRDAASVAGAPFYVGALSTLGVLVWWVGGVACLLAGAVLARRWPGDPRLAFLRVSGWLTLWLAFDDMFQIHEHVVPVYGGIDERWILGLYGLTALAWIAAFRRFVLRTEFLLLLAAGACFAVSIAVDVTVARMPMQHLLEDGTKLVGIALWSAYLTRTSVACAAELPVLISPARVRATTAAPPPRPSWILARS